MKGEGHPRTEAQTVVPEYGETEENCEDKLSVSCMTTSDDHPNQIRTNLAKPEYQEGNVYRNNAGLDT